MKKLGQKKEISKQQKSQKVCTCPEHNRIQISRSKSKQQDQDVNKHTEEGSWYHLGSGVDRASLIDSNTVGRWVEQ